MPIHLGILVPIAIAIPNLLSLVLPPVNIPKNLPKESKPFVILERLGQIGVFLTPLFYKFDLSSKINTIFFVLMVLCLFVYYTGWARFFIVKREFSVLFAPLWGIPDPLAISPILAFVFASKVLDSLPLFIAALVLAAGHIPITINLYKKTKNTHIAKS
ncbi:MAG: hypothetical protein N3I35_05105 [Clostridia bacterium]|nr:hypothetical protein [Clostridia bacterium]